MDIGLQWSRPLACLAVSLCLSGGRAATSADHAGRAWYVDCASGSDAADGLNPQSAWRTTSAVSAHSFQGGDAILFRRGGSCEGMLAPKGSGTAAAPIRLDAWGTGPLPRIHASPGQEAALELSDQEYWTIQHLEFSGGRPRGVYITGTRGVLHGIHIRDCVVHDVAGEPKNKETGLLVIAPGNETQKFEDVLVDGVTAYRTSAWAGIVVGGVAHGFLTEAQRSSDVVVRNSIVHDVAGDGIVLFEVNRGRIENSVAWHTGMQETQTIGTPNAIWTWMCRNCTVRRNEAFLTDSPGVDGGAFDIDYGNADNTVEENYGHDTEGYCFAIFAAGSVTTNSIVRNNVCAANGRSPRLAERQGAVFLSTWNNGKIRGLQVYGNRIFWNPPIAAPVVVNAAEFAGPGSFEHQTIRSASPFFLESAPPLVPDNNLYEYLGTTETRWEIAAKNYQGYRDYQRGSGQDPHSRFARVEPAPMHSSTAAEFTVTGASRDQMALLVSLHRQFPNLKLRIVANVPVDARENLRFDWNLGDLPVAFADPPLPLAFVASDAAGTTLWRHDGEITPGDLGLAVRSLFGEPDYAQLDRE